MKHHAILTKLFLSLVFSPSLVFAGVSSSGGGGAVVCYKDQKIVSAELFDLVEGQKLHGQSIPDLGYEWSEILSAKIKVLSQTGFGMVGLDLPKLEATSQLVLSNQQFIPENEVLKLTEDNKPTFVLDEGCAMEQAATYVDDSKVLFDARIWNAFSPTSKAALVLHEILYRIDRGYKKVADSTRIRRVISSVLEGKSHIANLNADLPSEYTLCHTSSADVINNSIWLYHNLTAFAVISSGSDLILRFFVIGGDVIVSKTESFINATDMNSLPSETNLVTHSDFEGGDLINIRSQKVGDSTELLLDGFRVAYGSRRIPTSQLICQKVKNLSQ